MFFNHCHVFPEGAFGPGKEEIGTLPELGRFMSESGIERTVAFAPLNDGWPEYLDERLAGDEPNAWLYQQLAHYDNIVGAVTVSPAQADSCQLLEEYVGKGFVGVKTHPPGMGFRIDEPACDDFYARAAELEVFVLFHTGVHGGRLEDYQPLLIDNILARHPQLKVIIEHMGVPSGHVEQAVGRGFFDQAMAVIYNHSAHWGSGRAYAGLTGLAKPQFRELLAETIQLAGADHCIFGLDWPHPEGGHAGAIARYESERAVIHSLGLTQEQQNEIFGQALARLTTRD